MDTKLCVICETEKDRKLFRNRVVKGALYTDNICSACRSARERAALKVEMIEAFGSKCCCCDENNPAFLTLEHKERVHHKQQKRKCHQLMRDAKRDGWDRTKYEMLCFNCNCAKEHQGECPHRSGITAEQELARLKKAANARVGYNYRNVWGSRKGWFKEGFDERRVNVNQSNPA